MQQLNRKPAAQISLWPESQLIVKSGHDDNRNSLAKMKTKLSGGQKEKRV